MDHIWQFQNITVLICFLKTWLQTGQSLDLALMERRADTCPCHVLGKDQSKRLRQHSAELRKAVRGLKIAEETNKNECLLRGRRSMWEKTGEWTPGWSCLWEIIPGTRIPPSQVVPLPHLNIGMALMSTSIHKHRAPLSVMFSPMNGSNWPEEPGTAASLVPG